MSQVEDGDFDLVHPAERVFKIGGESFHWRVIGWREMGPMYDKAVQDASDELARLEQEGAEAKQTTFTEDLEALIERIVRYVEKDEISRFREVVNSEERVISPLQLNELAVWLETKQNERPTNQPSPSDAGRGRTAPTLQVA